jgi:hypothetical protein
MKFVERQKLNRNYSPFQEKLFYLGLRISKMMPELILRQSVSGDDNKAHSLMFGFSTQTHQVFVTPVLLLYSENMSWINKENMVSA